MPRGAVLTERDCHNCDGQYIHHDGDLYCDSCGFTPRGSADPNPYVDDWTMWRRGQRSADEADRRVYMVGGHPAAYVGNGEYEYSYDNHQFNF